MFRRQTNKCQSDLEYSVVAKRATQRLRVDVWRDIDLTTKFTAHRLVAAWFTHNEQTEPSTNCPCYKSVKPV